MDFAALFESLMRTLGAHMPSIVGALGILVVVWLVAMLIKAAVRRGRRPPKVDEHTGKGWEERDPEPTPPGSDPNLTWVLGEGSQYFFPDGEKAQPWIPVIVRLKGMTISDFAQSREFKETLRVSPLFLNTSAALAKATFCGALVRRGFFDMLRETDNLGGRVARVTLSRPLHAKAIVQEMTPSEVPQPDGPPEEGTVVVGIIDDGIAFAHERFRDSNGNTRVEYAWLQELSPTSPVSLPTGRELRKADLGPEKGIDSLIADATRAGLVDEDQVYRESGLIDYLAGEHQSAAYRLAHGTHVMDAACGFDPASAPDSRPIVCVQLPTAITADTSGAGLTEYVLGAMRYILDRADAIAVKRGSGPLPVVINFSYGNLAGPHDGTSDLEEGVDELIELRRSMGVPFNVVLPSGNSHLGRVHAQAAFNVIDASTEWLWRVQPDDRTPSFLQIWLPHDPAGPPSGRVELQFTPPGEARSPPLPEGALRELVWRVNGQVVCEVRYIFMPAPTERGLFRIALHPTASFDVPPRVASAGPWIIKLQNRSLSSDDEIHGWIQRDDTPYGYRLNGRQSYFDHECYLRFDNGGRPIEVDDPACDIRRDSSMNAIATGKHTVVVGSFLCKEMRPARYSAGGPTIAPAANGLHRDGPDALAPGDDSVVHVGRLAAGSHSGSTVAMSGTSVAAPQIARCIADQMEAGNPGDRIAVQAEAINQESTHASPAPTKERGGEGRIKRDPLITLSRYWP